MKIGIVTLYGNFNYGNRLQNYALYTALSQMGHTVETLVANETKPWIKDVFHKYFEKEGGFIKIRTSKERNRDEAFAKFTNSLIPTRMVSSNGVGLPEELNDEYDFFVVGSDQVWNPLWWGDSLECQSANDYLLKFAEPRKRLAYSASFGLKSLPEKWAPVFKRELSRYRRISVREDEGAKIVRDLVGFNASVTLDPTMLLTADQWRTVEKKTTLDGKYVFQFNLGRQTEAQIRLMDELRSLGYVIIDYMDPKSRYYGGDPSEFLGLIDGANCVLTDSFHAAVFSILFERPFVVFDREHANGSNMNSRINTLLRMFDLEERWRMGSAEDALSCDYSGVNGILEENRGKSWAYLRDSLMA